MTRCAETKMDTLSAMLITAALVLAFVMMCASGYQLKYAVRDLYRWTTSTPSEYTYEDLPNVPITGAILLEVVE